MDLPLLPYPLRVLGLASKSSRRPLSSKDSMELVGFIVIEIYRMLSMEKIK
jgi:hypothetical protein